MKHQCRLTQAGLVFLADVSSKTPQVSRFQSRHYTAHFHTERCVRRLANSRCLWIHFSVVVPARLLTTSSTARQKMLLSNRTRRQCFAGHLLQKVVNARWRCFYYQVWSQQLWSYLSAKPIARAVLCRRWQWLEEFYNLHAPAWRAASAETFLVPTSHPSGHGVYQLRDRWLCEQLVCQED